MLLALLYHKIGNTKYGNSIEMLEAHFQEIAKRYTTVLPGESLPKGLSVCLTFDDAFFDFYHLIFPLLKKYHLKALLAVPTAFIPEKTTLSPMERLEKIRTFSDHAPPIPSPAFCTWSELKELSLSPLIQIASHSIHHCSFTSSRIDPEHEYLTSKKTLEDKLGISITSFVYPYGKMDKEAHALAKKHYEHIFRIGNAVNKNWQNTNGLLYRVNGDQLPHPRAPFRPLARMKYSARYLLNTLRGK